MNIPTPGEVLAALFAPRPQAGDAAICYGPGDRQAGDPGVCRDARHSPEVEPEPEATL